MRRGEGEVRGIFIDYILYINLIDFILFIDYKCL